MKPDIREEIIEKYQRGKQYIDKQGMVDKTKKCWNFYLGNQWEGLETGGEVLPFYNFIKPTVRYKVSTICQNKMTATYSDLKALDENVEIFKAMNIKFAANWEKADMNSLSWDVIKAAAVAGDSYTYWYAPHECQILDNVSVLLGDEQNPEIQEQPYIIIRERVFASDAIEIAKANNVPESEYATIVSDLENDFLLNKDTDIDYNVTDGKCLSLIYLTKEDDVVWFGRTTMNCMYQPMRPIRYTKGGEMAGKGLTKYPIVSYIWETQPDSARGNSEVGQLIPNQIQTNRLLAQRAIAIKQCAFPRLAYDATAINNPEDIDTIGAAIELNGNAQGISSLISYLNPAGLNGEGTALQNEMVSLTREMAGASENILGQIDPTRVAASAIAALQEQSAVNINEQVAKYEQYAEDTARLWWEMDIAYNDTVQTQDSDGNFIDVTPEEMEELVPDVRVDISQDTAFTKESALARMDKLLEMGAITVEEWAELLPQNSPLPKADLLKMFERRKVEQMQQQGMMPPEEMPEEEMPVEEPMMEEMPEEELNGLPEM